MKQVRVEFNQKIIKDYMEKHQLSMSAFCKLCKITPTTYKKIFNNVLENMRVSSVYKIAKTLNVRIMDLIAKTEIVDD